MPGHDIICIGASAGGVEALVEVVSHLPHDLPAAIFVVLHVPAHTHSMLPAVLTRAGPLPANHVETGDPIEQGFIYIAPPDYHLVLRKDTLELSHGPRENGFRPAVDPLFRSAAYVYGPRVVGVVLSGALDDGTAGLLTIKARGGVAVVQDPEDALFPGMPGSAIENVNVDHVLPAPQIAVRLNELAHEPVPQSTLTKYNNPNGRPIGDDAMVDIDVNTDELPIRLVCPDCGGPLWELGEGGLLYYQCHTGHKYSPETLFQGEVEAVEKALWTAIRVLKEKAIITERLAAHADQQGRPLAATRFKEQGQEARLHIETLRRIITGSQTEAAEHPA